MRRHAMSAISPTHKAYCLCGWTGKEEDFDSHLKRSKRIFWDRMLVLGLLAAAVGILFLVFWA